ncbi:alkaline phosphatase [Corynebacterium yudongzhengii]|uniref:alkaline phosphatase n=1 Tax=Corynebacterium yudongzhengii TaxID=2080740 RepID=UPI002286FD80|nr:alkaline phosphatase [Corynebacterium yudongzhengii]
MTSLRRTSRASLVAAVSALTLAGGILPASASSLSSGSSLGSSFGSSQGSGFGSSLPGSSFLGSSEPGADDDAEAQSEDPENIIYMIGDGMGYNHVASTNFFETGQSRYQVEGPNDPAQLEEAAGDAVQVYEQDDFHRLSMTTFPEGKSYDPQAAWTDHDYIKQDPTDSAAAGTAMATGTKTTNGSLGVDSSGEALENVSELAAEQGKSAGVVSSVPFSHAPGRLGCAQRVAQ